MPKDLKKDSVRPDSRLMSLLASASLMVMAGGILAPIVPELIAGLRINPSLGSSLVSLHFLTVAISTPLFGWVADRFGQRNLLICILIAYGLVGMAGGLMQAILPLMILRGLLGVASGGIAAASLGLVGKLYQGADRTQVIAYVTTTLTLANIVYPLLGGAVGLLQWRWVFGLYGLALPLAVWVYFSFRVPPKSTASSSQADLIGQPQNLRQLLTQISTLHLLLTLSLTTGTVYAMIAYLPLYLKTTIAANTPTIGILLATQAIGAAVISALGMRRLNQRLGTIGSIGLGLGVMGLMLSLTPHMTQLPVLFLISLLFGMGFGLVLPNLYDALAKVAPAELQSSVLAAGTGSGFFGQFLSPILLGMVLAKIGLTNVFYIAAAVDLIAGVFILTRR